MNDDYISKAKKVGKSIAKTGLVLGALGTSFFAGGYVCLNMNLNNSSVKLYEAPEKLQTIYGTGEHVIEFNMAFGSRTFIQPSQRSNSFKATDEYTKDKNLARSANFYNTLDGY